MKTIPLTQGKFAIVDDCDFEWLNQWKWIATWDEKRDYWRVVRKEDKETIYMHRAILGLEKNDGIKSDHKDHNGLNNQRYNLRKCTDTQNRYNQKPQRWHSSKYKGVSWSKKEKRWKARITYNSKDYRLGCYKNEIDAAKVYDIAAKKLFGEFAYLNFPKEKQNG
ncbi:MAG: AP2 domain-containing protein [Dehalococcoidia bacterium]|nr:AP2 domain-containing protein [Dehalococcoidia bacterium]